MAVAETSSSLDILPAINNLVAIQRWKYSHIHVAYASFVTKEIASKALVDFILGAGVSFKLSRLLVLEPRTKLKLLAYL